MDWALRVYEYPIKGIEDSYRKFIFFFGVYILGFFYGATDFTTKVWGFLGFKFMYVKSRTQCPVFLYTSLFFLGFSLRCFVLHVFRDFIMIFVFKDFNFDIIVFYF